MEYRCNICKKQYSSYQSLWIHNKKYHNPDVETNQQKINNNQPSNQPNINHQDNNVNAKLTCKTCNRVFSFVQSRWRHEQKCKNKEDTGLKQELEKVKEELAILKQEQQKIKATNINKGKIYNTNNTTNNTNNTTNIVKFGTEDIMNILDSSQIMKILNSRLLAVEESIKTIHFNEKLPEYQNIRINNLRSNVAMIHDGERFNAVNQYGAIDELIDNHFDIITHLIEDNQDKLGPTIIDKLNQFVDKINDNYKKFFDANSNREYNTYKDFKINQVKHIIYNESTKLKNKH